MIELAGNASSRAIPLLLCVPGVLARESINSGDDRQRRGAPDRRCRFGLEELISRQAAKPAKRVQGNAAVHHFGCGHAAPGSSAFICGPLCLSAERGNNSQKTTGCKAVESLATESRLKSVAR